MIGSQGTVLATILVGAALGISATGGAAILLYTQHGFLATAGFLISLTIVAIAAGLWAGAPAGTSPTSGRRGGAWTAAIVALGASAAFAAVWIGSAALRASTFGGAAAVLIILAAPGYTLGLLLAGLAHRAAAAPLGPAAAVAALIGIAGGVLASANWLIPRYDAPHLFLGAGLMVALAATSAARRGGAQREVVMPQQTVIVTGVGAEGQLGFTIAQAFLAAGANVVVTGTSAAVETLATRLDAWVAAVRADLTQAADAERVVATALDRFGRLDAVINTAGGLSVIGTVEETSADELTRELERNVTTAFVMSRAALPALRETRGAIVCFAAPAGQRALRRLAAYSAAKAGVIAFTRSLALEERDHGLRINAIAPGPIDTEQNRTVMEKGTRFVSREEVARVALFLAGPAASGISGETIRVMGDALQ
jgi:NAD(P)-dependent dehydrogenase (short-subunit alcohol dehydrogenase family)